MVFHDQPDGRCAGLLACPLDGELNAFQHVVGEGGQASRQGEDGRDEILIRFELGSQERQ